MTAVEFFPPRDCIRIDTSAPRILALADRLWTRTPELPISMAPIVMQITVRPDRGLRSSATTLERDIRWSHADDAYTVELGDLANVRIDFARTAIEGSVTESFLIDTPSLASRTLLEAPAAVLLSRRAHTVLHAAAVVGRRGAIVIRGGSGRGKSTLTAAAWKAGFAVLADESLLVAREDHDDLAACVRDLTLLPQAADLLGLDDAEVGFSGGEEKRRIDLFGSSTPSARRARRIATILLGDREPGPARLTPLSGSEFMEAFREGSIPEERTGGGSPDAVAESWGRAGSYRLDGAVDLVGAVEILRSIAG